MSKIAIITLNGYFNFGNRLQNYALQKALEKMEFDVETVRYELIETNKMNVIKQNLVNFKTSIFNKEKMNKKIAREKLFKDFSNKYIKESHTIYNSNDNLKVLSESFDKFVIGSDQVWNPSYNGRDSFYFGGFTEGKNVVSYSASFGVSEIDKELSQQYSNLLKRMRHISVRETEGAKLVENLIGVRPPVLVDPTVLIDQTEWLDLTLDSKIVINEKYILTYFLHDDSHIITDYVNEIQNKTGLKVINLMDESSEYYISGPSEFLYLINYAELFLTNSFHGTIFSIIFDTPFVIFDRGKMNSRINTILSLFDLENRKFNNIKDDYSKLFDMQINNKKITIDNEQQKAYEYIKKAIII